jgi:hypothetical protein
MDFVNRVHDQGLRERRTPRETEISKDAYTSIERDSRIKLHDEHLHQTGCSVKKTMVTASSKSTESI